MVTPSVAHPERVLTICGESHPASVWARALERAREHGVKVFHRKGEWFATSASKPGELYHINGACECTGAVNGRLCQHLAAVRAAQYKTHELERCHVCGQIGSVDAGEVQSHEEWIGGQGFVTVWQCSDPQNCWQRFDRSHAA